MKNRLLTALLLILILAISFLALKIADQGFSLDTNLQALFPETARNIQVQQASERLFNRLENQVLILLAGKEQQETLAAARMAMDEFLLTPVFTTSSQMSSQTVSRMRQLYLEHAPYLLSQTHREWLIAEDYKAVERDVAAALFGADAMTRLTSVQQDPLGWVNAYFSEQMAGLHGEDIVDGFVTLSGNANEEFYVLLPLEIAGNTMKLNVQTQVADAYKRVSQAVIKEHPQVEFLHSGMVFHAAEASGQARKEITLISLGSVAGILLLFFAAFASLRPLLLSLASVIFGCLVALAFCLWWFERVHVLTLVFGASLIGVAVDYSLHYFSHAYYQAAGDQSSDGRKVMRHILPGISLSLLTTVIGYSCLLQAPLPGLRQMAAFSVTGLASSWLFVVVVNSSMTIPAGKITRMGIPGWLMSLSQLPLSLWRWLGVKRAIAVITVAVAAALCILLAQHQVAQDIRLFYTPPEQLAKEERTIRQQLAGLSPSRFFLVTGATAEQLLVNEELLTSKLDTLIAQGKLRSYNAISSFVPSQQRQQQNFSLQKSFFYATGADFLKRAGFSEASIQDLQKRYEDAERPELSLSEWLQVTDHPAQQLWLGAMGNTYGSLVTLQGETDVDALSTPGDGIFLVDKVKELSDFHQHYTRLAWTLLLVAIAAIFLVLLLRYRDRRWLLLGVPVLSGLFVLALLAACGQKLTLFHVFGLYLVLGLGLDYVIFLTETGGSNPATLLSIFLSAITSILAFGLLSLSSTPMVAAFGVSVFWGTLFNLLLTPLIGFWGRINHGEIGSIATGIR